MHYTGYMTDMPKLKKLAKKYNIPVVEDACQLIQHQLIIRNQVIRETLLLFLYTLEKSKCLV